MSLTLPRSAVLYFATVFAAGLVLGIVRVPLLVPRLGARVAELLEMPLMLVVIVLASKQVLRRLDRASGLGAPLAVGLLALGLMIAAELAVAVVLAGRSVADYIVAGRDPVSGAAYIAMLGIFAAMPCFQAWRRRRRADQMRPTGRHRHE